MMLYVLCEEPSMKEVLDVILPQILPDSVQVRIFPHQGKQDLEKALKSTVPTLSRKPGVRIVITCDQDQADCKMIKQHLKHLVGNRCRSPVLYRIVCRQLECWFLGDLQSIEKAFPRFRAKNYVNKEDYRDVDSVKNPESHLLAMIPEYKERQHLPKIETAKKIAPYLTIQQNRSTSFNHFISGICKLIVQPVESYA